MIDLIVSLNGEEFEVRAAGDVYDAEMPDFNSAVRAAMHAHFLEHPLHELDVASLEVGIRRVHTDRAPRDGVGVDEAGFQPEDEHSDETAAAEATEDADALSDEELDRRTAPDRDSDEDEDQE